MGARRVIADTCIWIEYFRGKSSVSEELKKLIQNGEVFVSGPVIYELIQGAKNKNDSALIKETLQSLSTLEVTHEIWLLAGDLFFDLRRKGITLPPSDVLLSAVAITTGSSLFTMDKHFDHIEQVRRHEPILVKKERMKPGTATLPDDAT
jgi:predicted nucleic acid-binding protein